MLQAHGAHIWRQRITKRFWGSSYQTIERIRRAHWEWQTTAVYAILIKKNLWLLSCAVAAIKRDHKPWKKTLHLLWISLRYQNYNDGERRGNLWALLRRLSDLDRQVLDQSRLVTWPCGVKRGRFFSQRICWLMNGLPPLFPNQDRRVLAFALLHSWFRGKGDFLPILFSYSDFRLPIATFAR